MAAEFPSVDETPPEASSGGNYELFIQFASYDPEQLSTALDAMWSYPSLEGPYEEATRFADQEPISPATSVDPEGGRSPHIFGTLALEGGSLPCGSIAYPVGDRGFLTLYLTWGAVFHVGVDFDDESPATSPLLAALDRTLADVGRAVFAQAPFQAAAIGPEGGWHFVDELLKGEDVRAWKTAYLLPEDGQLRYSPYPGEEQAL